MFYITKMKRNSGFPKKLYVTSCFHHINGSFIRQKRQKRWAGQEYYVGLIAEDGECEKKNFPVSCGSLQTACRLPAAGSGSQPVFRC